jgi:hypothetical protein
VTMPLALVEAESTEPISTNPRLETVVGFLFSGLQLRVGVGRKSKIRIQENTKREI